MREFLLETTYFIWSLSPASINNTGQIWEFSFWPRNQQSFTYKSGFVQSCLDHVDWENVPMCPSHHPLSPSRGFSKSMKTRTKHLKGKSTIKQNHQGSWWVGLEYMVSCEIWWLDLLALMVIVYFKMVSSTYFQCYTLNLVPFHCSSSSAMTTSLMPMPRHPTMQI